MHNLRIIKLPVERWSEYKQLRLEALKLEPTAFASTPEEKGKDSDLDWENSLKDFIEGKKETAYFVEINGKLVGMQGHIGKII